MEDIINIKVVQKTINDEKKRFVNARELHQRLGVGKFFANWIKDRIEKYDFEEKIDYFKVIPHKDFDLPKLANQKNRRGGDVRSIDYKKEFTNEDIKNLLGHKK